MDPSNQMPPSYRQGVSVATVLSLVVAAGVLGALCGGVVTYGAMTIGRRVGAVTAGATEEESETVRNGKDFGHPVEQKIDRTHSVYSFGDLDISIALPFKVKARHRKFPPYMADSLVESDDYGGSTPNAAYEIGAYWKERPSGRSLKWLADYNINRSSPGLSDMKYTTVEKRIEGFPAILASGTYKSNGRAAAFTTLYIERGNGLYYIQNRMWAYQKPAADVEWKPIEDSIHFLNKAPLER